MLVTTNLFLSNYSLQSIWTLHSILRIPPFIATTDNRLEFKP